MGNAIRDRLRSSFDVDKLEQALFYKWKYGLRFELSTGGSYVEMFVKAYDRARELLEHTFNNSEKLYVLLRFYGYIPDENKKPKEIRRLKRCGFEFPEGYLEEKFEENYFEYLMEVETNSRNYLAILWAICSKDLGIQPSAKINAYFIDFNKQIIAHPYDDRGMDIVAVKKDAIAFMYRDYYSWLLDYDLEIIQSKFQ